MSVNDRFEILMKRKGYNPNSLASDLGFAGPVIYNIVGGRKSKPSYDLLNSIKMKFPEINMNWLVSNEGDMEMPERGMVSEARIIYKAKEDHKIPVFPYKVAANALMGLEANEPLVVTDHITLPKWMLRSGTHAAVQVRGLSMQGVIHDGSYVVVKKIDEGAWSQFTNGNIHLVYTDTYGAQIKYLRRSERNPSFLILESENSTEHAPIHIHFNEILQLWAVELAINFKFVSNKREIVNKLNDLEMAYYDLTINVDQIKEKLNVLDKKP